MTGKWAKIPKDLQARADAEGLITWDVSVDSTITMGLVVKSTCGRRRPRPRILALRGTENLLSAKSEICSDWSRHWLGWWVVFLS
jgi:hypothetical protein